MCIPKQSSMSFANKSSMKLFFINLLLISVVEIVTLLMIHMLESVFQKSKSMSRGNKIRFLYQHESCECKCRLNISICKSKQKWSHN